MEKKFVSAFLCPVCGENLYKTEHTFCCSNGHSFDRARAGYVNLLRTQSSGKRHGDDRRMIRARTEFLETGLYNPLLQQIAVLSEKYASKQSIHLLDAGCGEGWYTEGLRQTLSNAGHTVEAYGIDISRDALSAAGKRSSEIRFAVASVSHVPVGNNWCDEIINVFAPMNPDEFARILSPSGVWIRAVPLEEHLFGFKAAIYEKPYLNKVESEEIPGWSCIDRTEVRYPLSINNPHVIQSLFWMTPYAYKTGVQDQQKLESLHSLETEVAFGIRVYRLK